MPLEEVAPGEDPQPVISENIRRLIHEGRDPRQAKAIAYRKAREEGADVPPPRGSLTERSTKRYLFLAVRKGNQAEAERYAKDLAGIRGDPSTWGEVLAEHGGKPAASDEVENLGLPLRRRPKAKSTGLKGVYDRNPKVCLTATVTVSAAVGVKINQKIGPLTVLGVDNVQPSTVGMFGLGGLALFARQMKWYRTAKLSLAGAVGQGIATGIAHAPDGALMAAKPGGPKT